MKAALLNYFKHKNILILGFGREGQSLYNFLKRHHSDAKIAIVDIKTPTDHQLYLNANDYFKQLERFDIIVKSPGFVLGEKFPEPAKAKITCLSDLFIRFCPAPIIGVTATKGKSTTSSLVEHILKKVGKKSLLVGNIGKACFDYVDEIDSDYIVAYELSSQQLEFTKHSPHVAILLNIYTDHLNYHGSIAAYAAAKKHIFQYQKANDLFIYGDFTPDRVHPDEIKACKAQKISLETQNEIAISDIKTLLVGDHNKKDAIAAILACEFLGIDRKAAMQAIQDFSPLEHRLEHVGNFKGIDFYNDSIATNQEAVIAGIKALPKLKTIIVGGARKGFKYDLLVNFLLTTPVENILLLPDTDVEIQALFDQHQHHKNLVHIKDLAEGVKLAYQLTPAGFAAALEPAAASFNQFKNFEERGEKFRTFVQKYSA